MLSNNKPAHRKGSVQLIHAVDCHEKMRKSLVSKRKQLSEAHVTGITRIFATAAAHEPAAGDLPLRSKLFPTTAFSYEIPFNRHFYTYTPPRQLDAIDTELATVTGEIQALLQEVAGA